MLELLLFQHLYKKLGPLTGVNNLTADIIGQIWDPLFLEVRKFFVSLF